jgi:hypothetical protein
MLRSFTLLPSVLFSAHPFQVACDEAITVMREEARVLHSEVKLLTEVRDQLQAQVTHQKEVLVAHERLLGERRDEIIALQDMVEEVLCWEPTIL